MVTLGECFYGHQGDVAHRGILKHQFYSSQLKVKMRACVSKWSGLSQVGRACSTHNACILMLCTAKAHSHMQRHAQLQLLLEQVNIFNHQGWPQGIQGTPFFTLCFDVMFEASARGNGGWGRMHGDSGCPKEGRGLTTSVYTSR